MNTIFDIRSSVDVERFSRIKEIERKMLVYTIRLCFGFGVGWAIEDAIPKEAISRSMQTISQNM